MNKSYNVLWTGGWDSTFRVIQLAKQGSRICPYYIIDTNRRAALLEIKRMEEIKIALMEKYKLCKISDINFISVNSISIQKNILNAYKKLNSERFLGIQYLWISALSRTIDNLELCNQKPDGSPGLTYHFIRKMMDNRAVGKTEIQSETLVFGRLNFPILNYTKLMMKKEMDESGDLDILCKSWFCHKPIRNTPCGLCNPCKYALAQGMQFRFTKRGLIYSKAPFLFKRIRRLASKFA